MPEPEPDTFIATRRSLITRLKNWDDHEGWREFFQTYWKLIYSVALKSGLTGPEAEDVVQETVVTIAKTMDKYRYEREKCRFKTWLLRITRMRIVDQLRKRTPDFLHRDQPRAVERAPLDPLEQIPDPASLVAEQIWDEEWRKNLVDAAMERVKKRVPPQQYQIFYLSVVKELRASQIARALGVSLAKTYLGKHRVAALVRREVERLEKNSHLSEVAL